MASASVLVLPLLRSDLVQAATLQGLAFNNHSPYDDPKKTAVRWSREVFTSANAPETYLFMKAVRRGEEDTILGIALWVRPGMVQEKVDKRGLEGEILDAYSSIDPEKDSKFKEIFDTARREVMGEQAKNTWYLQGLAVLPSAQRQSIGTSLLRHVFPLAESQNIPVCLEANPTGRGLYEKMGMKVEKEILLEGLPFPLLFMVKWGREGRPVVQDG